MSNFPSIFNDVMGPVMRGPSSSHCAASLRIGRLCRDLMDGDIAEVLVEFDPQGSLAATYQSQGADLGLFGGFLGWEADDERLPNARQHLAKAAGGGIVASIHIRDIAASHPNTYQFTLSNARETHQLTAISVGGGMVEVIALDGHPVSMAGDCFVTLVYCDDAPRLLERMRALLPHAELQAHAGEAAFLELRSQTPMDPATSDALRTLHGVLFLRHFYPVLPVLTRKNMEVPFITCTGMLAYNQNKGKALWELAVDYESARADQHPTQVFEAMRKIARTMGAAISIGLQGTYYADRILGAQSLRLQENLDRDALVGGQTNNRIILYVSAVMEVKSSMGVIVAAPTAGSCGVLPGTLFGVAHAMQLPEDDIVKALLAAGLIGVFIAARATFAAEMGGCMAETGSAGGMAAAALVGMQGGTLPQSLAAASMALQNSLGIVCDPIAGRAEAPCLGRNVMAAANAVSCANMALSDYAQLIPLDEVIATMKAVGDQIHTSLRCTNLGGLSITPAAEAIVMRLRR